MAERKKGPWRTVRISKWTGGRLKPIETVFCPALEDAKRVAEDVMAKGLRAEIVREGNALLLRRSKSSSPSHLRP